MYSIVRKYKVHAKILLCAFQKCYWSHQAIWNRFLERRGVFKYSCKIWGLIKYQYKVDRRLKWTFQYQISHSLLEIGQKTGIPPCCQKNKYNVMSRHFLFAHSGVRPSDSVAHVCYVLKSIVRGYYVWLPMHSILRNLGHCLLFYLLYCTKIQIAHENIDISGVVLGPTKPSETVLSREEECSNILAKFDEYLITSTKLTVVSNVRFNIKQVAVF